MLNSFDLLLLVHNSTRVNSWNYWKKSLKILDFHVSNREWPPWAVLSTLTTAHSTQTCKFKSRWSTKRSDWLCISWRKIQLMETENLSLYKANSRSETFYSKIQIIINMPGYPVISFTRTLLRGLYVPRNRIIEIINLKYIKTF